MTLPNSNPRPSDYHPYNLIAHLYHKHLASNITVLTRDAHFAWPLDANSLEFRLGLDSRPTYAYAAKVRLACVEAVLAATPIGKSTIELPGSKREIPIYLGDADLGVFEPNQSLVGLSRQDGAILMTTTEPDLLALQVELDDIICGVVHLASECGHDLVQGIWGLPDMSLYAGCYGRSLLGQGSSLFQPELPSLGQTPSSSLLSPLFGSRKNLPLPTTPPLAGHPYASLAVPNEGHLFLRPTTFFEARPTEWYSSESSSPSTPALSPPSSIASSSTSDSSSSPVTVSLAQISPPPPSPVSPYKDYDSDSDSDSEPEPQPSPPKLRKTDSAVFTHSPSPCSPSTSSSRSSSASPLPVMARVTRPRRAQPKRRNQRPNRKPPSAVTTARERASGSPYPPPSSDDVSETSSLSDMEDADAVQGVEGVEGVEDGSSLDVLMVLDDSEDSQGDGDDEYVEQDSGDDSDGDDDDYVERPVPRSLKRTRGGVAPRTKAPPRMKPTPATKSTSSTKSTPSRRPKRALPKTTKAQRSECDVCDESFSRPSDRDRHKLAVHWRDLPRDSIIIVDVCPICKEPLSRSDSVNRHIPTNHNGRTDKVCPTPMTVAARLAAEEARKTGVAARKAADKARKTANSKKKSKKAS